MNPQEKLERIESKILAACKQAGRPRESVTLLAVSKTKSSEEIRAFFALGIRDFGENYMQEAQKKQDQLKELPIRWHFIGVLQSNKAKFLAGNFYQFHGLDSLALAKKIDAAAAKKNITQECLIEINLDHELSKGGIPPRDALQLLDSLNSLKNLSVKGLMCIPSAESQEESPRKNFSRLRELLEELNSRGNYKSKLTELSMGMSSDYESAILEGSTIIRIGTLLFGERTKK